MGVGDVADGGLDIGTGLAEALEVLLANKVLGCRVHEVEVQLIVDLPRISPEKRILPCVNIIMVCA